jgi:ankyrin repeat protein
VSELGRTALWLAAKERHAHVVRALLKAGADVNKADKDGYAPLSMAEIAPIATMLIKHGADVNAANKRGETALWLAAWFNRAGVVEVLLQAGADVNKADEQGNTPLSTAEIAPIATMLIKHGADVNVANKRGETALWRAAWYNRAGVVEVLLKAGADVNKADKDGFAPLSMAKNAPIATMLIKHGADVNVANKCGLTALWVAAISNHAGVVEVLLQAGADVNVASRLGRTALMMAAQSSADNVLLLLAAGAATVGVTTVDCCNRDVVALMMAGGVVWTELETEQVIRCCGVTRSEVSAAKKRIERAGFAAIRARLLEICIALQSLALPAPQLIEIVTAACAPFAAQLPYHYLWDAVVLVKHFDSRGRAK